MSVKNPTSDSDCDTGKERSEEPVKVDHVDNVKKEDETDNSYNANNTASSCDYSPSQLKDEPRADFPSDDNAESDTDDDNEESNIWFSLEHNGPFFAPDYKRLPKEYPFIYDGKEMNLSGKAEEIAGFYAKIRSNNEYAKEQLFIENFFVDWLNVMEPKEADKIKDFEKCNFTKMNYTPSENEKAEQEKIENVYGFCTLDGKKEKINNFRIEPPTLFKGKGEHPNNGKLKKRVNPEDVNINCSKNKEPKPPPGKKWNSVVEKKKFTWLASYKNNLENKFKYIKLSSSSKLEGKRDLKKFDIARQLNQDIDDIRTKYRDDWKANNEYDRQHGVALHFIDNLALRAGHISKTGTVGCCSLCVEHIQLNEMSEKNIVELEFTSKDSVIYKNKIEVNKEVYHNLESFVKDKNGDVLLFDKVTGTSMNNYLKTLKPYLTTKVFRTYHACILFENKLNKLTPKSASESEANKILAYNKANREVAVLLNHKRAIPKNKTTQTVEDRLKKVKIDDPSNEIALDCSKRYYLDPRITVAWCYKHSVSCDKVYNEENLKTFNWAIKKKYHKYKFKD